MNITIKKTDILSAHERREAWSRDPLIRRFLNFGRESVQAGFTRPEFIHHFEIYLKNRLVGDVKVFGDQKDRKKNIAQLIVVLGESRGMGIGSKAVGMVVERFQGIYKAIYCRVNRYNLTSIRMLRRNGFVFKNLVGNEFILEHEYGRIKKREKLLC
ncbi:MAG TPA: GNAT family N-acetyltransferase [Caldithrix abyssi]|uniref:GNAT family N-acetyltransferase n=1 Tax=Caldithrix abyssi TaxID=187145 RepID=A0A7V1LKC8_CALAY|nr:GNAT family N-acetyltransferase [Caldithrix abyssi]